MLQKKRKWIIDKTWIPFIITCPRCAFMTNFDGAFEWDFCPVCGDYMVLPGKYAVPSKEEWIRRYGTNKQIAGFKKRQEEMGA